MGIVGLWESWNAEFVCELKQGFVKVVVSRDFHEQIAR